MSQHSNKKISYNPYRKCKEDFILNQDKVISEGINTIETLYLDKI